MNRIVSTHRRILLLACLLGVSGLFAVVSFRAWVSLAPASPDPAPSPTPAHLTSVPDVAAARGALAARNTKPTGFAEAVELSNTPAVLSFFKWTTMKCDDLMYRGVNDCQRRGVAKGTVIELFSPDSYEGGLARGDIAAAVTYLLEGRHPRLSMVAERSDGSLVILFVIDPRPDEMFPGGIKTNGPEPQAIWFATLPADATRIATYGLRYVGSPPLEFLRYDDHFSGLTFKVLGASTEFQAMEQAFHDRNESERKTP